MQQTEWDLPPPPGVTPVKGPRLWRTIVIGIFLIALLFAAWRLPIPIFYAYLPGPVEDVQSLIEIDDATTYSSEGKLLMTTVSVDTEVTLLEAIASFFDADKMIIDKNSLLQEGGSLEELRREQQQQMQDSQQHAREVALSALDLAQPTSEEVRIQRVQPEFPADGVLRKGDVVVAVDGQRVGTSCEVGNLIDSRDVGETVSITVLRDGRRRTLDLETAADPGDPDAPLVGIYMEDVGYRFDPGLEVTFDTGRIAGPSAGLMLSLGLYDTLTPGDLTGGRVIAGTGEIRCDGGVGPIGGVEQKVAGAEARGADVFLAPAGNAAAARLAADEIEIIAVSNFNDAIDYLEAGD